jgi:hypothetical protein
VGCAAAGGGKLLQVLVLQQQLQRQLLAQFIQTLQLPQQLRQH